jgi:hypothetical protein
MTELKELLEQEENRATAFLILALAMCLEDLAGKTRPYHGKISCPRCENGELQYVAKRWGKETISARCTTAGCLSWSV